MSLSPRPVSLRQAGLQVTCKCKHILPDSCLRSCREEISFVGSGKQGLLQLLAPGCALPSPDLELSATGVGTSTQTIDGASSVPFSVVSRHWRSIEEGHLGFSAVACVEIARLRFISPRSSPSRRPVFRLRYSLHQYHQHSLWTRTQSISEKEVKRKEEVRREKRKPERAAVY